MLNRRLSLFLAAVAAVCLGGAIRAHAGDTENARMLVAKPQLNGSVFESSILIVKPLGGGGHIGFIVNKPTTATLGQLFPEHEPSQKADHLLFLGGPQDLNLIFALVERHDGARGDSLQITPDLYLAVEEQAIDRIIEREAEHARFLVGLVSWAPGELDQEFERGYWFETEPDAKLLLRKKTDGLWDELIRREDDRAHMI